MPNRTYKAKRAKRIRPYDRLLHICQVAREALYISGAIASIVGLYLAILALTNVAPTTSQCKVEVIQVIRVEITQPIER